MPGFYTVQNIRNANDTTSPVEAPNMTIPNSFIILPDKTKPRELYKRRLQHSCYLRSKALVQPRGRWGRFVSATTATPAMDLRDRDSFRVSRDNDSRPDSDDHSTHHGAEGQRQADIQDGVLTSDDDDTEATNCGMTGVDSPPTHCTFRPRGLVTPPPTQSPFGQMLRRSHASSPTAKNDSALKAQTMGGTTFIIMKGIPRGANAGNATAVVLSTETAVGEDGGRDVFVSLKVRTPRQI